MDPGWFWFSACFEGFSQGFLVPTFLHPSPLTSLQHRVFTRCASVVIGAMSEIFKNNAPVELIITLLVQ